MTTAEDLPPELRHSPYLPVVASTHDAQPTIIDRLLAVSRNTQFRYVVASAAFIGAVLFVGWGFFYAVGLFMGWF